MAETVSIACKLPHGLIMQLQRQNEVRDPTMASPDRTVKVWQKVGDQITIRGFAKRVDQPSDTLVIGGFAITSNVDAAFAKEWFAQNKEHPSVKGGFIYIHGEQKNVEGYAKAHADLESGLEATNPAKMPEEFRRNVETAIV